MFWQSTSFHPLLAPRNGLQNALRTARRRPQRQVLACPSWVPSWVPSWGFSRGFGQGRAGSVRVTFFVCPIPRHFRVSGRTFLSAPVWRTRRTGDWVLPIGWRSRDPRDGKLSGNLQPRVPGLPCRCDRREIVARRMTTTGKPMTTTATQERASRRGNGKRLGPILVSGCRLGAHFGISRQGVDALVAQGVIEPSQ